MCGDNPRFAHSTLFYIKCTQLTFIVLLQLSHKLHSLLTTPSLNEPITVYTNCTACWSHDPGGGAVSLLPSHCKDPAE